MSARRTVRPGGIARVQPPRVKDIETNRALGVLSSAVQKVQEQRNRFVVEVDLVVGTNVVTHSLGRACVGYNLTATVADATFAHAIDTSNLRPDREIWVVVVGVDQPNAVLEVF